MVSSTQTIRAIGTRYCHALAPMPAWMRRTTRMASIAYAVDEMASDAKTGRATILRRRWWCSSADGIGLPTRIRLVVEYMAGASIAHAPATDDLRPGCSAHGFGGRQSPMWIGTEVTTVLGRNSRRAFRASA